MILKIPFEKMESFLLNLRKKLIFSIIYYGRRLDIFVEMTRIRESHGLNWLFR